MTPLPVNPTVVIYVDKTITAVATNVAPDLKVIVCQTEEEFDERSKGQPFKEEHTY